MKDVGLQFSLTKSPRGDSDCSGRTVVSR